MTFFHDIEQEIIAWLVSYAYQPWTLYIAVVVLLSASSFGLPIPEELSIIALGLTAHIASHPEKYPPPEGAGAGVTILAGLLVAFGAVFVSDTLVYFLGRRYGIGIIRTRFFRRMINAKTYSQIRRWMGKYGFWSAGLFRFIPVLRFPGHLTCGMMRVPFHLFILVDGLAAAISVPTQVILIGLYGEVVLTHLNEIKIAVAIFLAGVGLFFLLRYLIRRLNRS